ncbi:YdeI/OmpD-associated family protein [Daejeonella lutea]|uniref:Bacteriocin-protection, YdeI or OmpD-Associated n=1 Tax=Daejeonella lutea TaxID=572036 RepID=A0A1T5AQB6_9SPHI|nr:YdeI/OmpD-associated family protein [Daejeonella lutea]SKB37231.1 Bacteriocin-protection, YdeI or OmpD-Associated [Daejeonella lutea]
MENYLAKKLQIKPGQSILLWNAPQSYQLLLEPLPENSNISSSLIGSYDHVHLFVKTVDDLVNGLNVVHKLLMPTTVFWVIYPKKSSRIKTNLDMMNSWEEPEKYSLRPVSSASIDETWTALRFKPGDLVKKSGLGKTEISGSEMREYIDVENRIVTLPPDLKLELENKPQALHFFETLSWTNKKEYVTWILTAKQDKTRRDRVVKAADMLASGKKNPTSK